MKHHVLIAYDHSASTSYCNKYHAIAQQVASKYPEAAVVAWNHRYALISHAELTAINRTLKGDGGTQVECVAQALLDMQFCGKLVLITDGEVTESSIEECDTMLRRYDKISEAEVHIVGNHANMSISCPFTRNCPHVVYEYDYGSGTTPCNHVVISSEDIATLDMIDGICTLAEFESKYESIRLALTARMMGKRDIDEKMHDQIVRLKGRIDMDVARRATEHAYGLPDLVRLCTSDFVGAMEAYKEIAGAYYGGPGKPHENQLADLMNITKAGLRGVFCHRLRRAEEIPDTPMPDVELSEDVSTSGTIFSCPITYDDETEAAILFREVPGGILSALEPNHVDDVINCPLNALNYPDVVRSIRDALDMSISVGALKAADALDKPIVVSPLSRARLSGAVLLGAHGSQVAAGNHTLGKLLVGGSVSKKLGNMDLWYAVVYFVLKDTPRFADILPFAEAHMKFRLTHGTTWASMSGQTKYVNVRVPLGVACWMVATSPLLRLPASRDMARAHVWHMDSIFELVRIFGGDLGPDADGLEAHARRLKTVYRLLSECKRDRDSNVKHMRHYQRCVELSDGAIVPLDGPADTPDRELAALSKCVHPNMSCDDVALPFDWVPPEVPFVVSWPDYGLDVKTVKVDTPVCHATARPYFGVPKTWRESFVDAYKFDASRCIPLHAWYVDYVRKHAAYPECADDMVKYAYQRCLNRGITTLPAPIMQFADEVVESYQILVSSIDPEEFLRRADRSVCIHHRIAIEQDG